MQRAEQNGHAEKQLRLCRLVFSDPFASYAWNLKVISLLRVMKSGGFLGGRLRRLEKLSNKLLQLWVFVMPDGTLYLEMPFCGGSMLQWQEGPKIDFVVLQSLHSTSSCHFTLDQLRCEKFGAAILQGDPDTFVRISSWLPMI